MPGSRSVYTVSQVNSYIGRLFRTDLMLERLYLKGEISNCKYHSSGHIYFSLKDEQSQIRCVMFASSRKSLNFKLEDGQRIIVFGSVGVYERDGSYQMYVTAVRPDGVGELYERFEALKQRLLEMGMFAQEYKQPIPHGIGTLGVVTAPTGAAVRDIINIAKRRNPGIQIILYPALVQGEGAAESIARGIRMLDRFGADTIIVGRGGGSIEDLWAFNEEIVARAIFDCGTPIISAVGHETDTTIADYAADLRAPTPSAAAELAVDDMVQVKLNLDQAKNRLDSLIKHKIDYARQILGQYRLRLQLNGPGGKLRDAVQFLSLTQEKLRSAMDGRIRDAALRLDMDTRLMQRAMADKLQDCRHRYVYLEGRLKVQNPQARLDAGFAYLEGEDGRAVRSVSQLRSDEELLITLRDGRVRSTVTQIEDS